MIIHPPRCLSDSPPNSSAESQQAAQGPGQAGYYADLDTQKEFPYIEPNAEAEFPYIESNAEQVFPFLEPDAQKDFPSMEPNAEAEFSA